MADIVVLRVEVTQSGVEQEGSLASGKGKNGSVTAGLAGGAIAGKLAAGGLGESLSNNLMESNRAGNAMERKIIRETTLAGMRNSFHKRTLIEKQYGVDWGRTKQFARNAQTYAKNITPPTAKAIGGVATAAAAVFSIYSNYQKAGLEMSGATHAAAIQGRYGQMANSAVQIGVAAMINPLLAAPMIAMKAYQLAQTNRKEIFEIQKSVMISQIMQRNLVKTIAERRF